MAAGLGLVLAMVSVAPAVAAAQGGPRLRLGLSGVAGGFVGDTPSVFGGIQPRIGVQLGDRFAIYGQAHGLVGRFFPEPSRAAGYWFNAVMFEFTIDDVLQLGGGPAINFVWGCQSTHQPNCDKNGPYFGADARIAFLVGGHGDRAGGSRSGLVLSLDVIPTWFGSNVSVALLGGIGFEHY